MEGSSASLTASADPDGYEGDSSSSSHGTSVDYGSYVAEQGSAADLNTLQVQVEGNVLEATEVSRHQNEDGVVSQGSSVSSLSTGQQKVLSRRYSRLVPVIPNVSSLVPATNSQQEHADTIRMVDFAFPDRGSDASGEGSHRAEQGSDADLNTYLSTTDLDSEERSKEGMGLSREANLIAPAEVIDLEVAAAAPHLNEDCLPAQGSTVSSWTTGCEEALPRRSSCSLPVIPKFSGSGTIQMVNFALPDGGSEASGEGSQVAEQGSAPDLNSIKDTPDLEAEERSCDKEMAQLGSCGSTLLNAPTEATDIAAVAHLFNQDSVAPQGSSGPSVAPEQASALPRPRNALVAVIPDVSGVAPRRHNPVAAVIRKVSGAVSRRYKKPIAPVVPDVSNEVPRRYNPIVPVIPDVSGSITAANSQGHPATIRVVDVARSDALSNASSPPSNSFPHCDSVELRSNGGQASAARRPDSSDDLPGHPTQSLSFGSSLSTGSDRARCLQPNQEQTIPTTLFCFGDGGDAPALEASDGSDAGLRRATSLVSYGPSLESSPCQSAASIHESRDDYKSVREPEAAIEDELEPGRGDDASLNAEISIVGTVVSSLSARSRISRALSGHGNDIGNHSHSEESIDLLYSDDYALQRNDSTVNGSVAQGGLSNNEVATIETSLLVGRIDGSDKPSVGAEVPPPPALVIASAPSFVPSVSTVSATSLLDQTSSSPFVLRGPRAYDLAMATSLLYSPLECPTLEGVNEQSGSFSTATLSDDVSESSMVPRPSPFRVRPHSQDILIHPHHGNGRGDDSSSTLDVMWPLPRPPSENASDQSGSFGMVPEALVGRAFSTATGTLAYPRPPSQDITVHSRHTRLSGYSDTGLDDELRFPISPVVPYTTSRVYRRRVTTLDSPSPSSENVRRSSASTVDANRASSPLDSDRAMMAMDNSRLANFGCDDTSNEEKTEEVATVGRPSVNNSVLTGITNGGTVDTQAAVAGDRARNLVQLAQDLLSLGNLSADASSTRQLSLSPDALRITSIKFRTSGHNNIGVIEGERYGRIQDFRRARCHRHSTYHSSPYGIFGLFTFVADLRRDLEWAEDASYRRQNQKPVLSWADFDAQTARRHQKICYFTWALGIVSTVMMIVSIGLNGWSFAPLSVNPYLGPESIVLVHMGARDSERITAGNDYARLFLPVVLHAGLFHFLFNMVVLWVVGTAVERVHGSAFTAALFCVAAVGGNIAGALFLPYSLSVGASGGLFGLLGLCLADVIMNWDIIRLASIDPKIRRKYQFPWLRVLLWLTADVLVNVMIGLTPYVDNFAHLGGLYYGFCVGLAFVDPLGTTGFFGTVKFGRRVRHWVLSASGLVAAIIPFVSTLVLLLNTDGSDIPCPGCRYISCVPFPFWKSDPSERWWNCDGCEFVDATLFSTEKGDMSVEFTCPYSGNLVDKTLSGPTLSDDDLIKSLPSYCRELCAG
jgi:membrane associated rhomboid family serine protease